MAPISDATFEAANASRFRLQRLFLTGVEVTQSVQHFGSSSHLTDPADRGPDNSLRLVSSKPACVRVYVAGRDVPPVTGTLEVWRRSNGSFWTSIASLIPEPPGEVTAVANPDYANERGTLASTLNFILPADLMCGTLRLDARVTAGRWTDALSVTVPVTLRQTLRIAAVMISYDGPASTAPGAPNLTVAAPDIANLQAMTGRTLTLFPVEATAIVRPAGQLTWTKPLKDEAAWQDLRTAVANLRLADGNRSGWVHVGLLPFGVPSEGDIVGYGGGGAAVTIRSADGTLAHEIGHACGLAHAPAGNASNPDPNYPTYEPYPSGSTGEYGLDVSAGRISNPTNGKDFMSAGAFKWISPYHHRRLIENELLNPKIVCVDLPWWRDVVWEERDFRPPVPEPPPFSLELPVFSHVLPATNVISMIVRVDHGRVSDVPHIARIQARAHVDHGVATPLTASLRGPNGELLAEGAVLRVPTGACGCGCHGNGGPEPPSYWAQAFVPDAGPGASLEITDGTTSHWQRTAPDRPVVITRFDAKVDRGGQVTAKWSAQGSPVECWLRYSRDGHAWDGIATALTGNTLTGNKVRLDARCLPSGQGLLQLVAHDGFFSHCSPSVAISLPHRPPTAAILHPGEGGTYVAGQTVRLWGAATTSEGQPVAAERCRWTLDGKDVGRGSDIRVLAPAAGKHETCLIVDDDSGPPAVATTSFVTVSVPASMGR